MTQDARFYQWHLLKLPSKLHSVNFKRYLAKKENRDLLFWAQTPSDLILGPWGSSILWK